MFQIKIDQLRGKWVFSGKEKYIYYGGTAYLGIPYNRDFHRYLKKGIRIFGSNYGSSRGGNILPKVYPEAESRLAEAIGMPSALTLSSGYLAAQALLGWISKKGLSFIKINGDHPSLLSPFYPGLIPPIRNPGWDEQHTLNQIEAENNQTPVVVSTSLNPLTGEIFSFEWIKKLNKKIFLIIDDSHGLGILGSRGRGIIDFLPENPLLEVFIVSSLGKAFGIPGGVILGPEHGLQEIRSEPLFLSSSPIPPAYLFAFCSFQVGYGRRRERLNENILNFHEYSKSWIKRSSSHPVFPIQDGDYFQGRPDGFSSGDLFDQLRKKRILISSFPYPSSEDAPLTRIVINALHSGKDLKNLAKCIEPWILP
jgi:7-keto-8-aminopelargonate synthetase-like enzyme